MNIALIFGPLAFLSIFHPSVQGPVWSLSGARVGEHAYKHLVSLERNDDGRTWCINAAPRNLASSVPEVVYGPFEMRGFGPYSMLLTRIWLNTNGDKNVIVTFWDLDSAREFYHVSNPYHSPLFLNDFKIKRLVLLSPHGYPRCNFKEDVNKALDLYLLETETGADSRARSFVVHDMEGNQEPILIFHSLEVDMNVNGDSIRLSISPQNCSKKYQISIEFEKPSDAQRILDAYTILKVLGFKDNLEDLEALPNNTYPCRPTNYEQGESSNVGGHQSRQS